ncbi:MAG: hypothetical protein ACRDDO_09045 [Plesiomonas shigelloides]
MLELKANHMIVRAGETVQPGSIFFEPNPKEEAYLVRVLAATPTGNEVDAEQPADAAKEPAKTVARGKQKDKADTAKDAGEAQVDDLVG